MHVYSQKMLDDLQELSRSYEAENRQALRRGHTGNPQERLHISRKSDNLLDIPYVDSRTHQKATLSQIPDDLYDQEGYQTRVPYTMAGTQPSYMAPSRAEYPPPQAGAYAGSLYPPGAGYGQGPTYPPGPAYPGTARPNTLDPYNVPYDPYGEESPRPSYPGGTRRETRVDPRDQRPDLRGADPRGYTVQDPRNDPRDIREARVDPRAMPGYSYSVNSPSDVSMRSYDEYPGAPMPTGRGGGSYGPPRMAQTGYDSRESPQMRDAYRHEPIREERRNRR